MIDLAGWMLDADPRTVRARNSCGPSSQDACLDTVAAAGLMAGPSAGLLYALSDSLYLTAALNTLLVIPNASFNADLNLGLAFRL